MSKRRRRSRSLPKEPQEAEISSLDHSCRGVTRIDGKTVFVAAALPGERVLFRYTGRRKTWDEGVAIEVLQASPDRVEPGCEHFGLCGGCSTQHMSPRAQIAAKQQILLDNLQHIGKLELESETVLPPLQAGTGWGYRDKARLGVRYVHKKERVLVGFRERGNSYIADLKSCPVLNP